MNTTTGTSGSTAKEEPEAPSIKLSDAPFAPVRWLVDVDFWKDVTLNVYSAAVIAVFTVTLGSIAQLFQTQQYGLIILTAFMGLVAIGAAPLLTLYSYVIYRRKHIPQKDRRTTIIVFAFNMLISLVAVSVVIVFGINNILNS